MNANDNTSFFDETVEDESITLNEDELNNILEDGGTSIASEEPDVVVIGKEEVAPTLDLSDAELDMTGADNAGTGITGADSAGTGNAESGSLGISEVDSDQLAAARELMDTPSPSGAEETVYVEPGFEDETGGYQSSGLTEATEISEITAFNDTAPEQPAEQPAGMQFSDESAQTMSEPTMSEPTISEPTMLEPTMSEPAMPEPAMPEPAMPEPAMAEAVDAFASSAGVDEEISLTGAELENIVTSKSLSVEEGSGDAGTGDAGSGDTGVEEVMLQDEAAEDVLAGETVSEETVPAEGVMFSDEVSSVAEIPAEIEETSSIGDIPESATAEELEFERLEPEELGTPSAETISEVEPIELESIDTGPVTPVVDEEIPMDTADTVRAVEETEETVEMPGITPLENEEPVSAGTPQAFDGIEEIDLEEPASAESVTLLKQPPAKSGGFKPYSDEPDKGASFFPDEDEDEAITLNSDELNNILSNAEVDDSGEAGEAGSMVESAKATVAGAMTGALSRDNLKEIFVYLDNLLDKLPEGEVKRFAESRYYDLYNQIFDELDII